MLDKESYRALKKSIVIRDSYEKMVEIPEEFLRFTPHPYQKLCAPYSEKSPFYLRESVVVCLRDAQKRLSVLKSGYRVKIFDAYRPIEVQKFMMEYDKNRLSNENYAQDFALLPQTQKRAIDKIVSHFWSPIADDIASNPPPHATGGALDLTLVDERGVALEMGSEIDELVEESSADYFDKTESLYKQNRNLLKNIMINAGFTQLPTEWWHFSYGDQIWAVDKGKESALFGLV